MSLPHADVRVLIRKALDDHFVAHQDHAFFAGVEGRLSYCEGLQGWPLPYAVFFFVDTEPEDTFTERNDHVSIQISVWAQTAGEAEGLAAAAYDLFENQELTADGLQSFRLQRDTPVPTMPETDGETPLWQSGICLAGLVQTIS